MRIERRTNKKNTGVLKGFLFGALSASLLWIGLLGYFGIEVNMPNPRIEAPKRQLITETQLLPGTPVSASMPTTPAEHLVIKPLLESDLAHLPPAKKRQPAVHKPT